MQRAARYKRGFLSHRELKGFDALKQSANESKKHYAVRQIVGQANAFIHEPIGTMFHGYAILLGGI
jgi:hypothetical protein